MSGILYILKLRIIQFCEPYHMIFLLSIYTIARFLSFALLEESVDQFKVALLFLLFPCGILSVYWETASSFLANYKTLPWFVPIVFSPSTVSTLWVYSCWSSSFLGMVYEEGLLTFVIHSGVSFSSKCLFISIASFVVDWNKFFETVSMYVIMARRYQIRYFFESCSEGIEVYFCLGPSSSPCKCFSMLFIHSTFCQVPFVPIFAPPPNCIVPLSFVCLYVLVHPPYLVVELLRNFFFRLCSSILSRYILSLLSFTVTFGFISSCCIVCFDCRVAFLFFSQHISEFHPS